VLTLAPDPPNCIPESVTVTSVLLFAVIVSVPDAPVPDTVAFVALLSVVILVVEIALIESSTYFLLAVSPSALGAAVDRPVIVPALADIVISPTERPFFTLKFLVVMVPFLPHDFC
jgi:hypothetical protein